MLQYSVRVKYPKTHKKDVYNYFPSCYTPSMDKTTERVIIVHFVGGEKLRLHGEHVPTFIENYRQAVEENAKCFASASVDKIIIHIAQVTFIEETTIEIESTKQ